VDTIAIGLVSVDNAVVTVRIAAVSTTADALVSITDLRTVYGNIQIILVLIRSTVAKFVENGHIKFELRAWPGFACA
jgi:hypothetical protein